MEFILIVLKTFYLIYYYDYSSVLPLSPPPRPFKLWQFPVAAECIQPLWQFFSIFDTHEGFPIEIYALPWCQLKAPM